MQPNFGIAPIAMNSTPNKNPLTGRDFVTPDRCKILIDSLRKMFLSFLAKNMIIIDRDGTRPFEKFKISQNSLGCATRRQTQYATLVMTNISHQLSFGDLSAKHRALQDRTASRRYP